MPQADSNSGEKQYLFAPCHTLSVTTFPDELVQMAGGPMAFMELMNDIRNTPLGPSWPWRPGEVPKDPDAPVP